MKKKPIDPTVELMRVMQEQSPKWDAITKIIQDEKEGITRNILSRSDDEGRHLEAKQIDDLITWHNFLEYIITLPEQIIASAEKPKDQQEPDFETYPIKRVRTELMQ